MRGKELVVRCESLHFNPCARVSTKHFCMVLPTPVERLTRSVGFTYELIGDPNAACQAFDRSRQNHTEMLRRNPGARIEMQGFATYDQFLAPHRQRAGCS